MFNSLQRRLDGSRSAPVLTCTLWDKHTCTHTHSLFMCVEIDSGSKHDALWIHKHIQPNDLSALVYCYQQFEY